MNECIIFKVSKSFKELLKKEAEEKGLTLNIIHSFI